MQIESFPWPMTYRRALFALVLFFVAIVSVNGYYSRDKFLETKADDDLGRGFVEMLDGTAARPFIYRRMLPWIANETAQVVPARMQQQVSALKNRRGMTLYQVLFDSTVALDSRYSFRYLIVYCEVVISGILAAYLMYMVCRQAGNSQLASLSATVFLLLLTPYFMWMGNGKIYDYTELAFMALAVLAALRLPMGWLVPIAAAGTWNKESFFFVVLTLYPLLRMRYSRQKSLLGTGLLAMVSLGVYVPIWLHYSHNSGGTVQVHLRDQLLFYTRWDTILGKPIMEYGILLVPPYTILPMSFCAWTIWLGMKSASRPFRQHAALAAVINLPLYLLFCGGGQIRNLSLLYITLLISLARGFSQANGA